MEKPSPGKRLKVFKSFVNDTRGYIQYKEGSKWRTVVNVQKAGVNVRAIMTKLMEEAETIRNCQFELIRQELVTLRDKLLQAGTVLIAADPAMEEPPPTWMLPLPPNGETKLFEPWGPTQKGCVRGGVPCKPLLLYLWDICL